MGKEVKIGLGIIAVLLCVFAAVLVVRLRAGKTATAANKDAKENNEKAPAQTPPKPKSKLSGGPRPPTRIAAKVQPSPQRGNRGGPPAADDRWSRSSKSKSGADPREVYMPPEDRYGRRHSGAIQAAASGAIAPDAKPSAKDDRYAATATDAVEPPADDEDLLMLEPPPDDDADGGGAAFAADDSSATESEGAFDPFQGRRAADDSQNAAELRQPAAAPREDPFRRPGSARVQPSTVEIADEPRRDRFRRSGPVGEQPQTADVLDDPQSDRYRPADAEGEQPLTLVDESDRPSVSPQQSRTMEPPRVQAEIEPATLQHAPQGETYVVEPNDNYWTISQKVYGSGAWFKALQHHNSDQYPNADVLSVGDVVSTPELMELEKNYPQLCPKRRDSGPVRPRALVASDRGLPGRGRVYSVRKGDTLFDIARHELGKASRWAEIYDLNRERLGEDFDYLAPGTELLLPEDGQDAPVTARQPQPARR